MLMKERKNKPDVTEQILNNEKISQLLDSLIQTSVENGYNKSAVLKALQQKWEVPQKEPLSTTEEEKLFFKKVDCFFADYGEAFLAELIMDRSHFDSKSTIEIEQAMKEPTSWENSRLKEEIMYVKTMYVVYLREDAITATKLEKYCRDIFKTNCLSINYTYLKSMMRTINNMSFFEYGNPIYNSSDNSRSNRIESQKKYKAFIEKYSFRQTDIADLSMKIIWIISNYY